MSALDDGRYALRGREGDTPFWIFPQGLPDDRLLEDVCSNGQIVKCIAHDDRQRAAECGHRVGYALIEDRDNSDYLYHRDDLAHLGGRKFHKKRNLVNNFIHNHHHELRPLDAAEVPHALRVLDRWRANQQQDDDYGSAKEALENMEALGLCGYIAYADCHPIAFAIGEGIARHRIYVIHFEKGLAEYKGVYQYINMAYSALLPKHYEYINREQDMGDAGLRQAKMTYRPATFAYKYRLIPEQWVAVAAVDGAGQSNDIT